MASCEPVCRNSLIVVPAFFLIFGGLILIFLGAAFSPKSWSDGITFSREARISISVPCIVTGAVLTSVGIIHCVAMAVCFPLAKQYLQRSKGNKLARQGDALADDTISVSSDDILAAEGEGLAIGPKRRRPVQPQETVKEDDQMVVKNAEIVTVVKSPVLGSPAASPTQPAKEMATTRLMQMNATPSGKSRPNSPMHGRQ